MNIAQRSFAKDVSINAVTVSNGCAQMRQLVGRDGQSPQFDQNLQVVLALQSGARVLCQVLDRNRRRGIPMR